MWIIIFSTELLITYLLLYISTIYKKTCEFRHLIDKIKSRLDIDTANVKIVDHGHNGACIKNILDFLPAVLETKPDVVILLWDSDCSNVDESKLFTAEVNEIRSAFQTNLRRLIDNIQQSGAFLAGGTTAWYWTCVPTHLPSFVEYLCVYLFY